jgi:N-acetylglutamate synthase-like GNAT family acetyltransferase
MSRVKIRSAQIADVESLGDLIGQLGYPEAGEELPSRLETLLADPHADLLVAADAGTLLGLVAILFVPVAHDTAPWCRITALVVDAEHRERGVGQALAAAAEEAARQAGCSRIEATSALHRTDAHHFYERLGFNRESAHYLKRLPGGGAHSETSS